MQGLKLARLVTISVGLILSGAMNTIAFKTQNSQLVYEGAYVHYFFHPFLQTALMFLGEFLALPVFYYYRWSNQEAFKTRELEAKSEGKLTDMSKFYLAIPAICDLANSTLVYISLTFLPGSVYQIMRGGIILSTALFTRFYLKIAPRRREVWGCTIATLGVTVVGLNSVFNSGPSTHSTSDTVLGIGMILLGLVFNGIFYVYEQKLLKIYHLEPLMMLGYEGLFGFSIYIVIILILNFVACPFGANSCTFTAQSFPRMESFSSFFRALENPVTATFVTIGLFTIACFNLTGIMATKYINAVARSIGDVSRTLVVWAVSIVVTVTLGSRRDNYRWENLEWLGILIQLLGFGLLIFGNLVNNGIVRPAFVGDDPANKLLQDVEDQSLTQ